MSNYAIKGLTTKMCTRYQAMSDITYQFYEIKTSPNAAIKLCFGLNLPLLIDPVT